MVLDEKIKLQYLTSNYDPLCWFQHSTENRQLYWNIATGDCSEHNDRFQPLHGKSSVVGNNVANTNLGLTGTSNDCMQKNASTNVSENPIAVKDRWNEFSEKVSNLLEDECTKAAVIEFLNAAKDCDTPLTISRFLTGIARHKMSNR